MQDVDLKRKGQKTRTNWAVLKKKERKAGASDGAMSSFTVQDDDDEYGEEEEGEGERTSLMPPSGPRKSIDISVLAGTYRQRYRSYGRRNTWGERARRLASRAGNYVYRRWFTFLNLHALYICSVALISGTIIWLIERNRSGTTVCRQFPKKRV